MQLDSDEPPSDDAIMHPPQSGPIRRKTQARSNPYSPKTPIRPPYPQQSPTHLAPTPSPLSPHTRIEPSLSPFPGLSTAQLKNSKEEFEKTQSKVDFIAEICQDLYGNGPQQDELVQAIAARLDMKPELRTFASLGTKDHDILNPGEQGSIRINHEKLAQMVPVSSIPAEFWTCLTTLRMVCARRMGMGVQQIIGHFLSFAVFVARKVFDDERLVLHTEWEVPATEIPGIGKVHGPLDFLTARAAGRLEMGNITIQTIKTDCVPDVIMNELDGAIVQVATPYFICVEAKRQQTLDADSSMAQLLAQVRALQILRFSSLYFSANRK
jgi:hypothetical protein